MTRRDPLATVLRVRQAALDELRQAASHAYQADREACAALSRASEAIEREARAATALDGGDEAVERYARWLPVGMQAVEQARTRQREAGTELDRIRAMLVLATAGVRTVEGSIRRKRAAEVERDARRDQAAGDEAARSLGSRRAAAARDGD